MPHVILLGDSILDNGAYVRGAPYKPQMTRRQQLRWELAYWLQRLRWPAW